MTPKPSFPVAFVAIVLVGCPGPAPSSDGLDDTTASTGSTTSSGAPATSSGGSQTTGGSASQGTGGDGTTSGGGNGTTSGGGNGTTSGGGNGTTSGGGDPATTSGGGDGAAGGSTTSGGEGGAGAGGSSASSGGGGEGGHVPECDDGIVDVGELCFTGAPTHYDGPRIPIPTDVDGDGHVDLVSMSLEWAGDNALKICPGDSSGLFPTGAACRTTAGRSGVSFAKLRSTALGLDAVGVAFTFSSTYGLRTEGTLDITWNTLADGFYASLATGDMNEDGDVDIVLVEKSATVRVFLNDGAGSFAEPPDFTTSAGCETDRTPLLVDFDGDGHLDLFVSCFFAGVSTLYPSIRVLRGDGLGGFDGSVDLRFDYPDGFQLASALGDVDEDGVPDVVIGRRSDAPVQATLEVLRGVGDGTFEEPLRLLPALASISVDSPQLVDLDLDGNLDVIATFHDGTPGSPTGRAYLFRGDGQGNFADAELLLPDFVTANGNASLGVTAVDLNGDGALDLVRGSPATNLNVGAGLDVFLATP